MGQEYLLAFHMTAMFRGRGSEVRCVVADGSRSLNSNVGRQLIRQDDEDEDDSMAVSMRSRLPTCDWSCGLHRRQPALVQMPLLLWSQPS